MILAKDLRTKYDSLSRVRFTEHEDYDVREKETAYQHLLTYGKYETNRRFLFDDAESAGYVVVDNSYEQPIYEYKTIKGFFTNKVEKIDTGKTETVYQYVIYLPEPDVQIENKSNYNLLIITNKGGNSTVRLDNMSMKEVSTFVENAYKIGALATGTGYISTSIIDKIDIKEV